MNELWQSKYDLLEKNCQMKLQEMLSIKGNNLYWLDFMFIGAIKRTLSNSHAFYLMLSEENIIAAAGMVRLNLDTVIRLYAINLVDDPNDLALNFSKGESLKDLKDRNGKKMNDYYLKEKISEKERWIPEVYKQLSGFIHFSARHLYPAFKTFSADGQEFEMSIGRKDVVKAKDLAEIEGAFEEATKIIYEMLESWILEKRNIHSKPAISISENLGG